ncbi:MAG TPA: hypothetical protein VGO67_03175 [Verrucomicrobiae bacterium]|jgi:hypothetical protein
MAWTKTQTVIVSSLAVLLVAVTAIIIYQHFARPIHVAEMATFSHHYGMKVGPAMLG